MFLTTFNTSTFRKYATQLGAKYIYDKPITLEQLKFVLMECQIQK